MRWEKDSPAIAGYEDGGSGLRAKKWKCTLEAGKVKETDSPLDSPERNRVLPTLWFSEIQDGLLTYKTER